MSVNNRLAAFFDYKKLEPSDIADDIQVSSQTARNIIGNKTTLGVDTIDRILKKYPTLSVAWLFLGRGEMEEETLPISMNELVVQLKQNLEDLRHVCADMRQALNKAEARETGMMNEIKKLRAQVEIYNNSANEEGEERTHSAFPI